MIGFVWLRLVWFRLDWFCLCLFVRFCLVVVGCDRVCSVVVWTHLVLFGCVLFGLVVSVSCGFVWNVLGRVCFLQAPFGFV